MRLFLFAVLALLAAAPVMADNGPPPAATAWVKTHPGSSEADIRAWIAANSGALGGNDDATIFTFMLKLSKMQAMDVQADRDRTVRDARYASSAGDGTLAERNRRIRALNREARDRYDEAMASAAWNEAKLVQPVPRPDGAPVKR